MDTSIRTMVPEAPSTDGSEDSWTFLDDVENNADADAMQSLLDVQPISGSSDAESVDDDEQPGESVEPVEHMEVGEDAATIIGAGNKSALDAPSGAADADTTGYISDCSVSLISGNEFADDIDAHQTPVSSLPPSPPASSPQPFWMRAHIPELSLRQSTVETNRNAQPPASDPSDNYEKLIVRLKPLHSKPAQKSVLDSDGFRIILAIIAFVVPFFTLLVFQELSYRSKIDHLRSVVQGLESENVKLQYRYTECRKVELAYNAQTRATDAAAAAAIADMQIADNKNACGADDDAEFGPINKIVAGDAEPYEPIGRKVWTSDGFVLQTAHLPPKKQFKYDDLCDKQIRDDLFSEYTSEYCEKVRQSGKQHAESKRAPVHTHQPRPLEAHNNDQPIFVEDFIDPNKFNPNAFNEDQYNEFKLIEQQANEADAYLDDEEFEFELQAPVASDAGFNGIEPMGYVSFEDALLKLDEHMERISFHTNSCYTKYKKLREDEQRTVVNKFDKSKADKSKKKQKEKRRDEKRADRKDEKRDKRERKYSEKKEKNFKRN